MTQITPLDPAFRDLATLARVSRLGAVNRRVPTVSVLAGVQEAWFYVTLLTIGYLISRGLAESGSRDYYDDTAENGHQDR